MPEATWTHRSLRPSQRSWERKIIDTYLVPDKTFQELREMLNSGSVDLLHDFTTACRVEVESFRAQQF